MNMIIYMYVERINKLIKVEEMRDTVMEDVWDRCKLYFNKNPHDYLIYDIDTGEWFIWNALHYYFDEVA